MIELNTIYNEDCIGEKGMCLIQDKSIDMILCDLPYGTTQNKWDVVIDPVKMWAQYERVIKDNGAIVLTAAQPFTSILVMSNPKLFRYDLVWDKSSVSGFLNASKMPLRTHEDILIFYKKLPKYNPIKTIAKTNRVRSTGIHRTTENYGNYKPIRYEPDGFAYPKSILNITNYNGVAFGVNVHADKKTHPTQKPVDLFRYLIKTYSNEGDTVLDNCMGSGTTAIACMMENRNFIGFENDKEHGYYAAAMKRIEQHRAQQSLFNQAI